MKNIYEVTAASGVPVHVNSDGHLVSRTIALSLSLIVGSVSVHAQGTGFSYQGRLSDGTNPANGSYVFRFSLNDGKNVPVGSAIVTPPVFVSNGLFTVMLDFGAGIFTGADRRLNIEVHTNDNTSQFVLLAPPQSVSPSPYAVYAAGANVAGTATTATTAGAATNLTGSLAGEVAGTQTSTVVLSVGGQSATNIAGGVSAANAASSANLSNTIVKRDANGSFSAGSVSLSTALHLPFPAIIYSGTNTLLVNHGSLFLGVNAGDGETGANANVGVGDNVLSSGTSGSYNTGIGERALENNLTGIYNTAAGFLSLHANTSGNFNTASGASALSANSSGSENTANGVSALSRNTEGNGNTASGAFALEFNTTGSGNTANGAYALEFNAGGVGNTANGNAALQYNTIGGDNTAIGAKALAHNTLGDDNTATGYGALQDNLAGSFNTANGSSALASNTLGDENTANGAGALGENETGSENTATGAGALYSNTTGGDNTASGTLALQNNKSGNFNTAIGVQTLNENKTGSDDTAVGVQALFALTNGNYNTAIGERALAALTSGYDNIALGVGAGSWLTGGDGNIYIGHLGMALESHAIRIGDQFAHNAAYIGGIWGATVAAGTPVHVNSSGQLGTVPSSVRFKESIRSMDDASRALFSLRPVTFRYKPEVDPQATPQFGLVAEEVEQVAADLVVRDDQNQVYGVRYEAVNAMLLNEFLKQHRKVEEQGVEIQTLKKQNGFLEKSLNELAQTVQALAERK